MNPRNFPTVTTNALARIKLHIVKAKGVEGFPEIIQMIVLPSTFYQHVVNVDLDISSNLMCKHLVHEPLICRARVFKAKRHYFVIEEALASDERSLLLIRFVHFDLVVTRKGIHES